MNVAKTNKQCYFCEHTKATYEVKTPYDSDFEHFVICQACATKFATTINQPTDDNQPQHYFGDCPVCDDLNQVYWFATILNSCYDSVTMCQKCINDLELEVAKIVDKIKF